MEKKKQILTQNRVYIVKWLDPNDVIDELIESNLVGEAAAQKLKLEKTRQEKNQIIVDQLCTGGPGTLTQFCKILRRTRQAFIAQKLLETDCKPYMT